MSIEQEMQSQGGVISRRQVIDLGGSDNLIEQMVRRRLWKAIHPGVYVDHTGIPTDEQQRMAAVLHAWPAVLAAESALMAHRVRNVSSDLVTVAVSEHRRVQSRESMRVVRMARLDDRTLSGLTPPRLRLEDAVLQVASNHWSAGGEANAVALLSDVCQQRRTTPQRLLARLEDHPCLRGRRFLGEVLHDVTSGTYSLLEHRYLTRVERPHGLPRGQRQSGFRTGDRVGFRDVHYQEQRTILELDGRLGHEWASDQWADLERDLNSAAEDQQTTRVGWGAVAAPCRLAPIVGRLLQTRGWDGSPHPCPRCAL